MRIKSLLIAATLSLAIFVSMTDRCEAQRVMKNYNEAITANPLAFAFGMLYLNYEMQISKDNSLTLSGVFSSYDGWGGIGVQGTYKWYLFQEKDKAIKGFGFGPSLNVGYFWYDNDTFSSGITLAPGAEFSYKFIIDDFVLEPVLGINYNLIKSHKSKSDDVDGLKWQPFYLGVNLGYAW